MAADEAVAQRAKRTGLGLLPPLLGLDGLAAIMHSMQQPLRSAPLVAAVPVDWATLLRASQGSVPHFFAEFALVRAQLEAGPAPAGAKQRRTRPGVRSRRAPAASSRVAAAPGEAASAEVLTLAVLEVARRILGADVAPAQPLMEAGLDSLGGCRCTGVHRGECNVLQGA